MLHIQFCPRCGASIAESERYGKVRQYCPRCDYIHFANPKAAAVVCLTQGDSILLVKRGVDPEKGRWALPAGYIDHGEDPQAAAVREMAEETGLNVMITRLLDVMFDGTTIVIIYAAQVISGELRAGDDADEVRWFTASDLPELAFRSTQVIISRWLAGTI